MPTFAVLFNTAGLIHEGQAVPSPVTGQPARAHYAAGLGVVTPYSVALGTPTHYEPRLGEPTHYEPGVD